MVAALPLDEGCALLEYGFGQEAEEKMFRRWIAGPQFEVSFDEFKRQLTRPRVRRDEDIIADIEKTMGDWRIDDGNI